MDICRLFNTNMDKSLQMSDKIVTLAFCSEIVSNDISNKLNRYISKKK